MDRVLLVSIVVAIVMVAKVVATAVAPVAIAWLGLPLANRVAMDGGHNEGNYLKRLLFRRS